MKDVLKDKFSNFLDGWIRSSTIAALFFAVFFLHVIFLFESDIAEWVDTLLKWHDLQFHMKNLSAIGFDFFVLEYLANILWKIKNEITHTHRIYGSLEYEDYFQKEQRRHYFSAGISSIVLSVFLIDILANSQWSLVMIIKDHLKSEFCAKITFITIGLYFIYAVFQEIIWNRNVNET